MSTLEFTGASVGLVAIIIALVVFATIIWESRRRGPSTLGDAGRPEPRTTEEWRRAAERSSAASLARRWGAR